MQKPQIGRTNLVDFIVLHITVLAENDNRNKQVCCFMYLHSENQQVTVVVSAASRRFSLLHCGR